MIRGALIVGLACLPLWHAVASARSDVLATIRQFVERSNTGDLQAAASLCLPDAAVIDDFPPHAWIGRNACANWGSALAAFSKRHGITGAVLTTGAARHVDITLDRAYVVLPVEYAYVKNGKKISETGSVWAFVLQQAGNTWRIAAWAWGE